MGDTCLEAWNIQEYLKAADGRYLSGGLEYLGVAGGRGWAIHVKGLGDKKEEEAVKPLLNSNCANGEDLYF